MVKKQSFSARSLELNKMLYSFVNFWLLHFLKYMYCTLLVAITNLLTLAYFLLRYICWIDKGTELPKSTEISKLLQFEYLRTKRQIDTFQHTICLIFCERNLNCDWLIQFLDLGCLKKTEKSLTFCYPFIEISGAV